MVPPRVSLLASSYRSARFLETWLENLAAQTIWQQAELILVANEPASAEREAFEPFCRSHPQVSVIEVPREPLYRSWNRAISLARAPLLAIANVDDLRTPEGLELQVTALENDPEALFSYGGFAISDRFPPEGSPLAVVDPPAFDRETFTSGMHVGPFLVWRATGEAGTGFFDEGLLSGADMDLAIRLAAHGRGLKVKSPLGWYHDGGEGLSTSGRLQRIERAVLCLRYGIFDQLDLDYLPDTVRYCIPDLVMPGGARMAVGAAVPDYDALLAARIARWGAPGRHRRRVARTACAIRARVGQLVRRVAR